MSKDTLKVEKDIERSLERLKITFNQANPASSLISPFFYSVFSLLSRNNIKKCKANCGKILQTLRNDIGTE